MEIAITFVIMLFIYFMPTIIAAYRHHCNVLAIFLLNMITGWTFAGWLVAFIWSLTNNVYYYKPW